MSATPGPLTASRRFVTVEGAIDTWSGPVRGTIAEALETTQEDGEGRVWTCAGSAEDNARLWAASPDLLEALKITMETIRSLDPGDPSTETGWKYDECYAAWQVATDAIAKAEGDI